MTVFILFLLIPHFVAQQYTQASGVVPMNCPCPASPALAHSVRGQPDSIEWPGGQHQGSLRVPSGEGHLESNGRTVQWRQAIAATAEAPAHSGLQLLLQTDADLLELSKVLGPGGHVFARHTCTTISVAVRQRVTKLSVQLTSTP